MYETPGYPSISINVTPGYPSLSINGIPGYPNIYICLWNTRIS